MLTFLQKNEKLVLARCDQFANWFLLLYECHDVLRKNPRVCIASTKKHDKVLFSLNIRRNRTQSYTTFCKKCHDKLQRGHYAKCTFTKML